MSFWKTIRPPASFARNSILFSVILVFVLGMQGCCGAKREPALADNDPIIGTWILKNSLPQKTIRVTESGRIESDDFPLFDFFRKEWDFKNANVYYVAVDFDPPPEVNKVNVGELDMREFAWRSGLDYTSPAILDGDARLIIFKNGTPHIPETSAFTDGLAQGQTIEEIAAKNAFVIEYVFTKADGLFDNTKN